MGNEYGKTVEQEAKKKVLNCRDQIPYCYTAKKKKDFCDHSFHNCVDKVRREVEIKLPYHEAAIKATAAEISAWTEDELFDESFLTSTQPPDNTCMKTLVFDLVDIFLKQNIWPCEDENLSCYLTGDKTECDRTEIECIKSKMILIRSYVMKYLEEAEKKHIDDVMAFNRTEISRDNYQKIHNLQNNSNGKKKRTCQSCLVVYEDPSPNQ